jgi:hypothetical protein
VRQVLVQEKPDTSVALKKAAQLTGAAAALVPEETDIKTVTHEIIELNDENAAVGTWVTQQEILGLKSPPRHSSFCPRMTQ